MVAVRVTQRLIADRTLNNINDNLVDLLRLQDQLSTGRRVNAPSDDPLDARRAINARTAIGVNEQFLTNIENVGPQLLETTNATQTALDVLQRVRELAIQGGSDTNAPEQLDIIAVEVNELLESFVEQANAETNERFLFSGTRTKTPAFSVTRDPGSGEITAVTYEGNTDTIEFAVAQDVNVEINEIGSAVFQGSQDIFQTLIDLRDNLRAGDRASIRDFRIGELDVGQDQLLSSLSRVGSLQNRLDRLQQNIDDGIVRLQELLSDTIDADFAEVIVNLNTQSNAFQAALNAGARVIQPSLLNFVQ